MVNIHDINMISNWITDYFNAAGKVNAVIGISGGIDSAVTAHLCTRALGKERVLGVILPIESIAQDEIDAKRVISKLEIDYVTINEEAAFNRWYTDLLSSPQVNRFINSDIFKFDRNMLRGNAKARFRMMTLYALSEMCNGLVVGTTNKTEAAIGYATKNGDGGVDIEPIMDFYKTEIFEMAELLEVPEEIITKPPSAGLWPGQTDENEIGLSYKEIDRVLRYMEGSRMDTRMGGYLEASIDRVRQMVIRNEHKGKMPPHYKR